MGFLDFFSSEKRAESKLDREIRAANNKFKPKDYRQVSLSFVIEQAKKGNEVAFVGLLARFAVNAEPSTEDEKEKDWVYETLVEAGRPCIPSIRRALRSAESVTWIHRTLKRIVTEEEYKKELLDVLAEFDTEYERNPDRKTQTIMALSDTQGADVVQALLRFLRDVDETVRFQTASALIKHADEVAREPLLEQMADDESIRIRNEIIEGFATLGWSTDGFKKKIDSILPAGYRHEKSGKIVKLGTSKD